MNMVVAGEKLSGIFVSEQLFTYLHVYVTRRLQKFPSRLSYVNNYIESVTMLAEELDSTARVLVSLDADDWSRSTLLDECAVELAA
jgi:hypothetical protein